MGRAVVVLVLLCGSRMIAQEPPIDPYTLPTVRAACGVEGVRAAAVAKRAPAVAPELEAGKARVYVITETRGLLGSLGAPVLLGMDGRWFGANRFYKFGYSFVDVEPGVHHLCVASTVRGVLPHPSAAVHLARVDAVAGQTYYFFNLCLKLFGTLTLQPISADAGAMYVQALPSNGLPKVWKTPAAQAACGADPNKIPPDPPPPPSVPGAPAADKALVYFYSGIFPFGTHGAPTRIGIDGHWAGEMRKGSYVALQVAPGVHRLCSATKLMVALGLGRTLWLGELDAVAGKTYFLESLMLEPVDDSVATLALQRIAAMPKSDTPDTKELRQLSRATSLYSEDEFFARGFPGNGWASNSPITVAATGQSESSGSIPKVYFLLDGNVKTLPQHGTLNAELDGRRVASLQSRSWVSLPLAPGPHRVSIQIESKSKWPYPPSSMYLGSVDAVDGANVYFESTYVNSESDLPDSFFSYRLDPDEGAMLVALYPQAGTAHP